MYLSELDIIGISIALVSLMALVLTSSVANARLTKSRDFWRSAALDASRVIEEMSPKVPRVKREG